MRKEIEALIFKHTDIKDMENACGVGGVYLLKAMQQKTARNGNDYLTGSLADRSGTIPFIRFNYPSYFL